MDRIIKVEGKDMIFRGRDAHGRILCRAKKDSDLTYRTSPVMPPLTRVPEEFVRFGD